MLSKQGFNVDDMVYTRETISYIDVGVHVYYVNNGTF